MNNRHIQTFLTVSAAFFAMSAPMHSNASCRSSTSSNATIRAAQYAPGAQGAGLAGTPERADEAGRNN